MKQSPHTPENWDEASALYDRNITDWTSQYAIAAIEAAPPGPGGRVLEVAAGSGALTLELAPLCDAMLAVDYSQGMLDRLRPKLVTAGHDHVELRQMNGMALAIDDESFDHAYCQFGVMLFSDPAKGLSELGRVLAPGGTAVVSAWAGPERFESFGIFGEAIARAVPEMKPEGPPPIFSLSDPDVFTQMLHDAGFSQARVDFVERRWGGHLVAEFVEVFTDSAPPARALFKAIGPEAAERVRQEMRNILTERFGEGPVELVNTATLGVARR